VLKLASRVLVVASLVGRGAGLRVVGRGSSHPTVTPTNPTIGNTNRSGNGREGAGSADK
jgi:hypothetical protein